MEEKRKFENAFKDAFAQSEVDPSGSVWTSIELDLVRAEGGELKRRILFYKLVAAASVMFAMCAAGVGYVTVQSSKESVALMAENLQQATQINKEQDQNIDQLKDAELTKSNGKDFNVSETTQQLSESHEANKSTHASNKEPEAYTAIAYSTVVNRQTSGQNSGGVNEDASNKGDNAFMRGPVNDNSSMDPQQASSIYASRVQKLPNEVSASNIKIDDIKSEPDPFALMMAKLQQQEMELSEQEKSEKNKKSENLWTSVGFAAGGFNTVNAGGSAPSSSPGIATSLAATKVADKQVGASGIAYTIGVSMGTRLSNRWVLQGGLNYMTQSSDYTADAVVTTDYNKFKAGSLNEIQSAEGDFLASAAYNVNNSMQFVSVPLQAGYLIVDKKFGVQLNAGISTDLFLQNTLTPESDVLSKTTQGRGEDSPYRPLNFSGLLGTELTYRLGEHYRLAVNPGIRYPFNSIYKSELNIEAMPITFDVGLKFRYIFH